MKNISIVQATSYNLIAKFSTMIIQVVLNMILARLIEPAAFGIVSILTILINFFNLFADMGIGVSVIQKTDLKREEHNQLFTVSLYIGIFLALLMMVISYPISLIYNNADYIFLCPFVSVVAFINSLNTVPNALLSRDKRFDLIAKRSIICNFISGFITAIMAFLGCGIYALIFHSIISSVSVFIWNYSRSKLKFKLKVNVKNALSLLGSYSLFQLLFNILNYLTRNLDNLIVGATLGDANLGYYNKAYTLNMYPNTIFTNVVSSVLHPFIRDYKSDTKLLYQKLMQIIKPLSLLGVFIQITFFLCAEEIILVFYGSNWDVAAVCFKWLALCVWAQMLSSVCGAVFLGLQRTEQTLKCGIINFFLILLAITIGILNSSLKVLSISIAITYVVIFMITYYILIVKTMNSKLNYMIKTVGQDFCAIALFVLLTFFLPDYTGSLYVRILYKFAVVVVYYVAYLCVTKQIHIIKKFICKITKKLRKAGH